MARAMRAPARTGFSACIRSDAPGAFARRPGVADRVLVAVLAHCRIHAVRGRRAVPRSGQVALAEKILQRMLRPLRQVDLAFLQPLRQVVGRDVDEFDLVGLVEHVRHGFLHARAGDLTTSLRLPMGWTWTVV